MKKNRLFTLLAVSLGLVLTAQAGNRLPKIPEVKAWRGNSHAEKQTFAPVLGDDTIRYGSKTLSLSPDGKIRCVTQENGVLFNGAAHFFLQDLRKNGKINWNWQRDNLDKGKSKFFRSGRKYIWELWYKSPEVKEFLGLTQTLEVLTDGRIRFSYKFDMPADTAECKFPVWTFTMAMPESAWLNKTVSMSGNIVQLARKMKQVSSVGKKGPAVWTFGLNSPAQEFTVTPEDPNCVSIVYREGPKDFHLFFRTARLKTEYSFILDLRNGTKPRGKDFRSGVDLMIQENLLMPDNRQKNLVANGSFERGLEGWHCQYTNYDRQWDWEPFALDEKNAFDGHNSLRLNVRQGSGWRPGNPTIGPQMIIVEPGTYTLSFYAKAEPGKNPVLTVWLPIHAGGGAPPAISGDKAVWNFTLTGEWKRYQATFEVKPNETHLFIALFARIRSGSCNAWADAFQLEKGKTVTAFQPPPAEGRLLTSDPENFISSKDRINGRFRITTARPEQSGQVRIRVKNFFSEILLDRTFKFRSGKDRTAEIELPLDGLPGLGVFVVQADYTMDDGTQAYDLRRYARVEFQTEPKPNRTMFAVDFSAVSRSWFFIPKLKRWQKLGVGAKHWVSTLVKEDWDLYKKYGVKPYMCSMLAYMRGKPDNPQVSHFFILDPEKPDTGLVTKLTDPRILIGDYHLEAGGKITPEYLKKFKEVVRNRAKNYPFVYLWALGGELTCKMPNDWWGKGDTDQDVTNKIALLLKAFTEGVREGNPNAKVLQDTPANMSPRGGIAETDRLLEACNRLGVKFDIIGIHPYRSSPENPDLDSDAEKLLEMLQKRGYGKTPVLWSECMLWGPYEVPQWGTRSSAVDIAPTAWRRGPLSYDMGWTEKRSAAWYMRSWLVALKYSDQVIGATSGSTVSNFYMDILLTPYAAQLTSNTLCCILGDAKFRKDVRFAPFVRTYIFEDAQKRPVAAVWCHKEDVDDGSADAPVAAADFGDSLETVLDFMNSPRAFTPGRMEFPVSPFPLFFRGKPGTLDKMTAAFRNAQLISGSSIPPLEVSVNPQDAASAKVQLRNFISREFTGTLNGQKIKVPSAGRASRSVPLPVPLKTDAVVQENLPLHLKSDLGTEYHFNFEFEAFAVKRVSDQATIDSLDWNTLPQVAIKYKINRPRTSGSFRVGWNRFGIFVETAIKDAKFVHVEYPQPFGRWKNDCLQIYIDTLANARQRTARGFDEDDYEYGVFPDSKGVSAQVFRYRSVDQQLGLATQAPPDKTFAPDIPCRFSNKNGVLTYRVFFPAKYLLPMKLEKGWVFGFGLFAPDSNQPGKIDGYLTMDREGKACHNRPHNWPAAVLTE